VVSLIRVLGLQGAFLRSPTASRRISWWTWRISQVLGAVQARHASPVSHAHSHPPPPPTIAARPACDSFSQQRQKRLPEAELRQSPGLRVCPLMPVIAGPRRWRSAEAWRPDFKILRQERGRTARRWADSLRALRVATALGGYRTTLDLMLVDLRPSALKGQLLGKGFGANATITCNRPAFLRSRNAVVTSVLRVGTHRRRHRCFVCGSKYQQVGA